VFTRDWGSGVRWGQVDQCVLGYSQIGAKSSGCYCKVANYR
jgi:hypothetical protein